jgi:UDP-N-acetylmuramoyl-L-alanyl-D-glutamate--2,6-diaminopimelate ligase
MKFSALLKDLPITLSANSDPEILGIHRIRARFKRFSFYCETGLTVDGHHYAQKALESGAVALLVERFLDLPIVQAVTSTTSGMTGFMLPDFIKNPHENCV